MSDQQNDGPRTEVTYTIYVKGKVEAYVDATTTVTRSAVAKWAEVEESEVTEKMAAEYVEEADDAIDESLFDLLDIDWWDHSRAEVRRTDRVQVTPPGWVPLLEEPHTHTEPGHVSLCKAGRCYLDTRVDNPQQTSSEPSN